MEKQKNIPQLRFPEFKGEWEREKLGEVAEFKAGYAFKSEQMLSEKSNFQLLKMSNVYKNELRLDRNASYWENTSSKEKEFLLKNGDTILTLTGTVGKQDYGYSVQIREDNKYLLNQRLVLLREIKNKSNNDFISQIISNEKFLFYFFGEAKGGTGNQTNVSTEDVKNIQLFFPTLPEQTKNASFFTAIDAKLQSLKKKKSLLEDYKKGVMQKLFSQELRFKDDKGKEFPRWEKKKLGEVCVINPSNKKLPENFIYIDLESVVNGNLLKEDEMKKDDAPSRAQRILKENDILFQMVRPYQMNNLYFKKNGNYVASTGYAQIRTMQNSRYIYQYLHLQNFVDKVIEKCTGTSYPSINSTDLAKIKIDLPCIKEQTLIANYLSAIDEKINKTNTQIKNTEHYKKGLLQKMFI
jgi:type I restriction enzyme S subunit